MLDFSDMYTNEYLGLVLFPQLLPWFLKFSEKATLPVMLIKLKNERKALDYNQHSSYKVIVGFNSIYSYIMEQFPDHPLFENKETIGVVSNPLLSKFLAIDFNMHMNQ